LLRLAWTEDKMLEPRREAWRLVERERGRIWMVADALIRHRHLTATDVRWLKAGSVPEPANRSV
jgi:hypothetical protein